MIDLDLLRPILIFFGMFVAAGLGAPIPEEIAIVAAGLWTAGARPEYSFYRWLMLPVCIVGVVIADVLLYSIGRFYGRKLLTNRWTARVLTPEKRKKIEHNFHEYGVNILLVGRLVPGIRTPLFLTAGMMRLSLTRFFLADGLGAVLGNSILFFLAFWFGDQFKELIENAEQRVADARPLIVMIVILAVGLYLLIRYLRRPVSEGDPEDLPLIGHQVATHMHSHEQHSHDHDAESPGQERRLYRKLPELRRPDTEQQTSQEEKTPREEDANGPSRDQPPSP